MPDVNWVALALSLGLGVILVVVSGVYLRFRPSRLQSSQQAKLYSWEETRNRSTAFSGQELSKLQSNFYIGTAASGSFVALMVSKHLIGPTSFDLLAARPRASRAEGLEVLLSTARPTEVLDAQHEHGIRFLSSGPESDALWGTYFR